MWRQGWTEPCWDVCTYFWGELHGVSRSTNLFGHTKSQKHENYTILSLNAKSSPTLKMTQWQDNLYVVAEDDAVSRTLKIVRRGWALSIHRLLFYKSHTSVTSFMTSSLGMVQEDLFPIFFDLFWDLFCHYQHVMRGQNKFWISNFGTLGRKKQVEFAWTDDWWILKHDDLSFVSVCSRLLVSKSKVFHGDFVDRLQSCVQAETSTTT